MASGNKKKNNVTVGQKSMQSFVVVNPLRMWNDPSLA
jgi:hypothetical protein